MEILVLTKFHPLTIFDRLREGGGFQFVCIFYFLAETPNWMPRFC